MRLDTTRVLLLTTTLALANLAWAQAPTPPADPRESIRYWRPYVIAPESHARVAEAHRVFEVLLRTWDGARIEPSLNVVESHAGPWAASLADGNILLSKSALDVCFDQGRQRAPHLLAFVLAHELSHQRADDLWHHKFFRLAGTQSSTVQSRMIEGLRLSERALADIGQREARADHDGLVLMASVGFDPWQVVDDDDFFTAWVESVWKDSCDASVRLTAACRDARNRALRSRVQLGQAASRATLYELGVHALVAGRNRDAMELFTAYGRDFPDQHVLQGLGVALLAGVLAEIERLRERGQLERPDFLYPLFLNATPPRITGQRDQVRGRSAQQLPARLVQQLVDANEYFERAIRLAPDYAPGYLLLATSHLVEGNPWLVRGVLQGRFLRRFGQDPAAAMLIALTQWLEGDAAAARRQLDRVRRDAHTTSSALPRELLIYAAYHNSAELARLEGDTAQRESIWRALADTARNTDTLLFQLAVARLTGNTPARASNAFDWRVAGIEPGMRLGETPGTTYFASHSDVWIDGTRLRVFRAPSGARIALDDRGLVRHAWRSSVVSGPLVAGDSSDRALASLGTPDRRVYMTSGTYLAYDHEGVGVHLVGQRIDGWFLYPRR